MESLQRKQIIIGSLFYGSISYALFEAIGVLLKTHNPLAYVYLVPYGAIRDISVLIWGIEFLFFSFVWKHRSLGLFLFCYGFNNALFAILSGNYAVNLLWFTINSLCVVLIPIGFILMGKIKLVREPIMLFVTFGLLSEFLTIEMLYYIYGQYYASLDITGLAIFPLIFFYMVEPEN